MGSTSDIVTSSSSRLILPISVGSAIAGTILVSRPIESVIVSSALFLFVLFLKDIRLIVPIAIFLCPLGPKFKMAFGNLYAMTVILGIAYLAWIYQMLIGKQEAHLYLEPPASALVGFVGSLLLAFAWAPETLIQNKVESFRFIQLLAYLVFFLMVLQMEFSLNEIRRFLMCILGAGVIEIFVGVYQWITKPGFYIVGTIDGLHTMYAVYVSLISIMLLGLIMEEKNLKKLLLWCILFGLAILTIVFSFCRTAYVALPLGILVLLVSPFNKKRRIVLLVSLLVLSAMIWSAVGHEVRLRAMTIINNLTGRAIDISFGSRLRHWARVASNVPQYILFGRGIATSFTTDNAYVKILTEAGLVGIGTFLWLLFAFLRLQWKIALRASESGFISAIAKSLPAATVACVVVPNLAMDTIWTHRFMVVYLILTALVKKWSDQESLTR